MITRLIIFATYSLHREAWCALLSQQPDISIAGATDEVAIITRYLQSDQPTTVLVDMPAPSTELVNQLRALPHTPGLLFLVQSYDLVELVAFLKAGATGCLTRDSAVGDLVRALIAAGRGELVLPPTLAVRALARLARGESVRESVVEKLTEREAEVLRLLAQGLTNKDIGQAILISVRTVEAHLRSIFAKLGVQSRTEAVLWAVKHGYGTEK